MMNIRRDDAAKGSIIEVGTSTAFSPNHNHHAVFILLWLSWVK
jgi:hypothetical protein